MDSKPFTAPKVCSQVLVENRPYIVMFDSKHAALKFCKKIRTHVVRHRLQGLIRNTILPNVYDDKVIYIVITDRPNQDTETTDEI